MGRDPLDGNPQGLNAGFILKRSNYEMESITSMCAIPVVRVTN